MLRFIFMCMGVVALSAISIATQVMTDGISETYTQIAERNNPTQNDVIAVAPVTEPEFSADQLNDIDTAAGADENDAGFGASFTNEAPKALADEQAAPAVISGFSAE